MEPRDGSPQEAKGEGALTAEVTPAGPTYQRTAPLVAPSRPPLVAPPGPPATPAGDGATLRADRCDDECQRYRRVGPAPTASRSYLARGPSTADEAPGVVQAAVPDVVPAPELAKGQGLVRAERTTEGPGPDALPPSSSPPPEVAPPHGRTAFCTEPAEPELRNFGSHSNPGPAAAEADKGNQDFAFHLELPAPDGSTWLLAGVADGVSQATWSARGARHVAAAFVETAAELFAHPDYPRDAAALASDRWPRTLAQIYLRRVLERFERDRDALLDGRHVDPTWNADLFGRTFWGGANAAREMKKWFQSTLLAAALGPHGGFALLLGDGFVRIDRRMPGGAWESSAGLEPTRVVSFGITEQDVFTGVVRIARKHADRLGVLVTTDGVSKSPGPGLARAAEGMPHLSGSDGKPPLERIAPTSSNECAAFLERLASLPAGMVDVDNMSLAFASRTLASGP